MASLAAALANLTTPHGRLEAAKALASHVYGPAKPGVPWAPRPYADNKGRREGQLYSAGRRRRRRQPPPPPARPARTLLCAVSSSRYLWTDAFGVVNFLSLAAETGDASYLQQAEGLITGGAPPLPAQPRGLRRAAWSPPAALQQSRLVTPCELKPTCSCRCRDRSTAAAAVHDTLGRERGGRRRLGGATDAEPTRCAWGRRFGAEEKSVSRRAAVALWCDASASEAVMSVRLSQRAARPPVRTHRQRRPAHRQGARGGAPRWRRPVLPLPHQV